MIKKILPISIFVLLLVIILLFGLQNMMNKKNSGVAITPTLIPGQQGYHRPGSSQSSSNSSTGTIKANPNVTQTPEEAYKNRKLVDQARGKLPVVTDDFAIEYSPYLEKIIITEKSDQATNSIIDWAEQNGIGENISNPNFAVITKDTLKTYEDNNLTPEKLAEKKRVEMAVDFFNIILAPVVIPSVEQLPPTATPIPTPKIQVKNPPDSPESPKPPSGKYTYYSQCGGKYDNYDLPGGCTVCKAGCGPTTVAMIVASLIDSSKTPVSMVDEMKAKGMSIGCGGSGIYDLKTLIASKGLAVSDFIIPSEKGLEAKEVVSDFRKYLNSGWTLFILANFKPDGGGHYFWVTDVTSDGKILSYDPYYGRLTSPPFNENQYSPAPYYRYAFAVKKK